MNHIPPHELQEQYKNGSLTIDTYLEALIQIYTLSQDIPKEEFPIDPSWLDELIALQQWTDDAGHTWRQMDDGSMLWWNGTDWQPAA